MLLRQPHGGAVRALLRVQGREEFPVDVDPAAFDHLLTLRFDDADAPDPTDALDACRASARLRWSREAGRPLTPPTPGDARAVLEFAAATRDVAGTVLFQCQAGVSRSTAAALLCLAAWTDPGEEPACVEYLLRVRPCAAPLRSRVRFGDTLMGRGGRLVGALRDARQHRA